jgi:mono/diheme cytochrome c family protein
MDFVRPLALAGLLSAAGLAAVTSQAATPQPPDRARSIVDRGRYLVQIAGCNDCHTAGYAQAGGKVAESDWLTGDALGWHGPWGTTYPTNLRLYVANMSEAQWLQRVRSMQPRPPMPWFNLRAMSDDDLRALFRYVKSAGPAGRTAPAYLPPGAAPSGPVVRFP